MDKAQRTSKTTLMRLFLIFFDELPPGLVGIKISFFFKYFLYFLWTGITRDRTTKIWTLNRGGMRSIENQACFLKTSKQLGSLKTLCFWIFFAILRSSPMAKRFYRICKILSPFYNKKLSQNGALSEKLCLFYRRYLRLWFWESTTWQIGRRWLGQSFPKPLHRIRLSKS